MMIGSSNETTALVLAAGLGTRLRPYTNHTPKALFTINQRPILAMAIDKLVAAGFQKILVNTHHLHRQIEAFVKRSDFQVPIVLRHEPEILGTGGAIRNIADEWTSGPLLVINADIVSSIDPWEVYRFHMDHPHCVTMVMHDRSEFNSVTVENGLVTGFKAPQEVSDEQQLLAFTGIHVLDRRVLDFLPRNGAAHIIDAYSEMIDTGEKISAYRARDHYWQDIGTPSRYHDAAYAVMAPLAFETAFGHRSGAPIHRQGLHGDGSDRRWYRLSADDRTLIMADHHIRQGRSRQEVDAYVDIGRHLHAVGSPVPRIFLYDRCSGLVFLEDLGDRHLQKTITTLDAPHTRALYERVIDQWLAMALGAIRSFDTGWTYQTRHYDRQVIRELECRYFIEAFVNGYLNWEVRFGALADEFNWLADTILSISTTGFMHRDLQSRNIMIVGDAVHFIDFQGGRPGPLQYDLASLLIDPYAALPADLQGDLLDYCSNRLQHQYGIDKSEFTDGYASCAVSRNLQILGAFAFLGTIKGKRQFLDHIPMAVDRLNETLGAFQASDLPKLKALAEDISRHMEQTRHSP